MESPLSTIGIVCDKLNKIKILDGYFVLDYFDDTRTDFDVVVIGIYLPIGKCSCFRFKGDDDEYDKEYFDLQWNELSDYTKLNILSEISERYC